MKRKMFAGSTSVMLPIFVVDSSSATGAGLGSLVFNTSSLIGEYRREDQSTWTTISLSTATLGMFTSGGWIADGGLAGAYEVGIPNAALAAGGGARWCVVRYYGAANMVPILIEIEIDAVNYQSSTAFVASVPAVVGNVGGNVTGTVASVVGNVGGNVSGNVTGTVASVVGNVAGNVTGSVGSVTAAVTLPANPPSGFLVTASYSTAPGWYAAAPTTSAIASAILVSPGNLLKTVTGGFAQIDVGQTGLNPRALDSVADGSLTIGDALVSAICAAVGKETVVSTTYTIETPSTGTAIRTFTLNSATSPTSRT